MRCSIKRYEKKRRLNGKMRKVFKLFNLEFAKIVYCFEHFQCTQFLNYSLRVVLGEVLLLGNQLGVSVLVSSFDCRHFPASNFPLNFHKLLIQMHRRVHRKNKRDPTISRFIVYLVRVGRLSAHCWGPTPSGPQSH